MSDLKARDVTRASKLQTVVSSCGVKAWLHEDYSLPIIAMDFAWVGGAAQDPLEKPGLTSFLAAGLSDGAGHLDREAFRAALDDIAAKLNVGLTRDAMRGSLCTLTRHADRAFELLGLAVNSPRFEADDIVRFRDRRAALLRAQMNDCNSLAERLSSAALFPSHPYGRPVLGDLAALPSITRSDIVELQGCVIVRDTLRIGVVGAIDAETLIRYLDHTFGGLAAAARLSVVPDANISARGATLIHKVEGPQSTIQMTWQGLLRTDLDHAVAEVVNHCFGGGGFSSRLHKALREARGLCYSVGSSSVSLDHAGMFVAGTATRNDRVAEAVDALEAEVAKLVTDGIAAEELDKAKRYLIASEAMRISSSREMARHLVALQLQGREQDFPERRAAAIASVEVEDTVRVIRRIFRHPGDQLTVIVGESVGVDERPPSLDGDHHPIRGDYDS